MERTTYIIVSNIKEKRKKLEETKKKVRKPGSGWYGNSEGHSRAGKIGGAKLAADREHMAELGRKGGATISQNREHMARIGRIGGTKSRKPKKEVVTIQPGEAGDVSEVIEG